jgi:hypothetical protein
MNPDDSGVLFEVEIDGRLRKGEITTQAIEKMYGTQTDPLLTVSESSEVTRGMQKRIAAGFDDDHARIFLNSMMLDEKGRWTI